MVAKVRANTSERLVGVARMVVFGLLAAVMGITALVLVLILFFRLLAVIPGPVWIPYLSVGAIFVVIGLFCWSKRTAKPHPGLSARPPRPHEVEGEPSAVSEVRDVIIVGSGPAGLTSAIYTARANLRPLVIEGELSSTGDQPGGQLMLTTEVENYPGFIDGIQGPELMANFRAQAARFGSEFITEKVTRVDFSVRPFLVEVGDVQYRGRSVIVSTGAKSKMLGLDNEISLIGHGVSTCATCDGFFFKGETIAVVGGGDSALEEATFLTKFASKVYVIHRRDALRASKIMQERAFKNERIEFVWDSVPVELMGDKMLEGVKVKNVKTGEETVLDIAGLFVAIGHVPNTALFVDQLDMDENGYLVTTTGTRTNVEGVFAAGDVADHIYRQAITAAGTGCMAAIDAERWLESQPHEADISGTPTEW